MKDILEIVILCLSLWIIIPTLMIIWIEWERLDRKYKNRKKGE